jgi:alpha-L-fucosidase
MNFDRWHDGTSYNLEALQRLGPEERASIEELLIENLKEAGDWRDVNALAALGTDSARKAVDKARFHKKTKVRDYALKTILNTHHSKEITNKDFTELEDQVVQTVKRGNYEIAEYMPTMRVKKALLDSTREAESVIRVNAAAFLLYLCGQAPEPFDWSQRPFFLRFSTRDPETLQQAWEELRKRTGL